MSIKSSLTIIITTPCENQDLRVLSTRTIYLELASCLLPHAARWLSVQFILPAPPEISQGLQMEPRDGFLKSIRSEISLCSTGTFGHESLGKSRELNLSSKKGGKRREKKEPLRWLLLQAASAAATRISYRTRQVRVQRLPWKRDANQQ